MTIVTKLTNLIDYSPRQVYAKIQARLSQKEKLDDFADSCPCIFVLSTGRVGTKTLSALLGLASNIFVYHEPKPKLYGLSGVAYKFLDLESENKIPNEILSEAFVSVRQGLLNYSLHCHKGYVETSPQTTFLAPIISQLIPNSKFIHLVRDPRMVIRSGMDLKWYDGNLYDRTRIVPRSESDISKEWDRYDLFQKNAWLWAETNRWIVDYFSRLPNDRKLLIKSEDIFSHKEEAIQKIFSFVGTSSPKKRNIEKVLGKKLNAEKESKFPKPSTWSESRYNALIAIAGETANCLGYFLGKH